MNVVYFADGRWAVEPYTGRKKPIGRFTCGPARSKQEVKYLVRRKMEQGYTFFTMRKVVIDAIQIKRKVGKKGVDNLQAFRLGLH